MFRTLLFIYCIITLQGLSPNAYNEPWLMPNKAFVADIYHGNEINLDSMVTDTNLIGVIHKVSEGLRADTLYHKRSEEAKDYELLWGSYHLGRPGDPIEQAEFYLSLVGCDSNQLLALDLEDTDSNRFMSLENARKFVLHIKEETGKHPFLYCNHKVLEEISNEYAEDSVFAACPLWYARFRKDIPNFENDVWDDYTLWQFSSEINCTPSATCLYDIPGTAFDVDINIFNGEKDSIISNWSNIGRD
ncbi:MAG: glycoside hydrolase family 25 protein [Flavobacteriales bacterium]|nr:glycoside hydrolase family 25 protein [Flavobacteriales bacterium]